jgi:uncharacterized membrane protein
VLLFTLDRLARGRGPAPERVPLKPVNPALLQHAEQRAQFVENRVADAITRFAGSMRFVYFHIIWFTA